MGHLATTGTFFFSRFILICPLKYEAEERECRDMELTLLSFDEFFLNLAAFEQRHKHSYWVVWDPGSKLEVCQGTQKQTLRKSQDVIHKSQTNSWGFSETKKYN